MLCAYLSIDDLFTAGLGVDLAGAALLAYGLLLSPRDIARQSGTFLGYNETEAVSLARNRVDGSIGFASIGLGFLCQGAAYAAVVGGVDESRTGWRVALGAVIVALAAAGLVVGLWLLVRERAVKRLLVAVARQDTSGTKPLPRPPLDLLVSYGMALGYPMLSEEIGPNEKRRYVRRVFGVDDAATNEELAAGVPLPEEIGED